VKDIYLIGPGDVLKLQVWNRHDLSDPEIIVGPDGVITVKRIGSVSVGERTREDVCTEIARKLSFFYDEPEVSLSVTEFNNNKAFVLGRVEKPGVVKFPGKGTLLEALSLAGGLPIVHADSAEGGLTRCSIIRGKDTIIWIDMNDLLYNGNMGLNARIQNNDLIFIPENESDLVYVMGEVEAPGAFTLTRRLTVLGALMKAGGTTKDATRRQIYLIRSEGDHGIAQPIDLMAMLEAADFEQNYLLQHNDVIFVPEKQVSRFNAYVRRAFPTLEVLNMGADFADKLGATPVLLETGSDLTVE